MSEAGWVRLHTYPASLSNGDYSMNLWHIIFNKGKRKPYKRKRSTRRPAQHRKKPWFVPGEMQQTVRLVEPDVVEVGLVRRRKSGRKRKAG